MTSRAHHRSNTGTADGECRPREHDPSRGAIQAAAAIALAAGALLTIPLLFGAGLLGTNDSANSGCGTPAATQPHASTAARSGVPATYLRLYQRAGRQYGLPWNILAAIGKQESDHGRDTRPGSGVRTGTNTAGAAGPMQIGVGGKAGNTWGGAPRHPAGQKTGGVGIDGNHDGWADVHDPADAIPAAARYLLAHGAPNNLQQAIFAYNHSTDYVHAVLAQAARYATEDPRPLAASATDGNAAGAGCPGDAAAYAENPGSVAAKVLTYARAQLGKPYIWGTEGPDTFDCSGLTTMAYRAAGISIPRVSFAQWTFGKRIPAGSEHAGDLAFFNSGPDSGPGHPGHVGIVLDPRNKTMIVAPHTGDHVKIAGYWRNDLMGFTRPVVSQRRVM